MFERRSVDVLSEDGEVLAVLRSVDAKAEKRVVRLGDMNEKLGSMDKKQNSILEDEDKTIGILGAIEGNT